MNYQQTYFNLFKKEYSSVPPQFNQQDNYIMRFNAPLPYYTYNGNSLTIIYFKKGVGDLIINTKKAKIENNKFIIANPNRDWEYINEKNKPIDVLSFVLAEQLISEFNFFSIANSQQLLDTPFESKAHAPFFIENCFNANHYQSGQLLKQIYAYSNTENYPLISPNELAFEVVQAIFNDQITAYEMARKIKASKKSTQLETLKRLLIAYEYIHDNLHKKISIEELSITAGLSAFYLYTSFKLIFGKTPHQYIIHQKINKAKVLLQSKSLTITQVSDYLNFPDLPTFSKLFKKIVGISPSAFML